MFDLLGLSCLANLGFEKKKNVELGEEEGALEREREREREREIVK